MHEWTNSGIYIHQSYTHTHTHTHAHKMEYYSTIKKDEIRWGRFWSQTVQVQLPALPLNSFSKIYEIGSI